MPPKAYRLLCPALLLILLTPFSVRGDPSPDARNFSRDNLFRLLSAEFAVNRDDEARALSDYLTVATETGDPAVTERALQIANFLQDAPGALRLSEAMAQFRPDDARHFYQIAYYAMKTQNYEKAISAIDRLLALDPNAELEALFLGAYPPSSTGRQSMLDELPALEKAHPDNSQLLFAHGLLLAENGSYTQGLEYVRRARGKNPDSIQAVLLEARLLNMSKQSGAAMDLLAKAVDKHPDNRLLNLNYARMLIRTQRSMAAEVRLQQMLATQPNDAEVLLLHGLLAYNNNHDEIARTSLDKLVLLGENESEAHYYLALLAKRQGNTSLAESHYLDVLDGQEFVAAQNDLAILRIASGRLSEARQQLAAARQTHPDNAALLFAIEADLLGRQSLHSEALAVLNEGLRRFPEDSLLLFNRAMTWDKLKNLPAFESDMHILLQKDPHNPSYLNAIGFTLVDETHRYGEAETYLREAYALKADDSAIIDSMGWLFYRLGNIQDALEYVQKAYNLSLDEEIGLHLAELLWMSNRKEEAGKVWADLLKKFPDSKLVPQHKAHIEQLP